MAPHSPDDGSPARAQGDGLSDIEAASQEQGAGAALLPGEQAAAWKPAARHWQRRAVAACCAVIAVAVVAVAGLETGPRRAIGVSDTEAVVSAEQPFDPDSAASHAATTAATTAAPTAAATTAAPTTAARTAAAPTAAATTAAATTAAPPAASPAAPPGSLPSLYCWSIMRPEGYEVGLMKSQAELHRGIFDCDETAVFSTAALTLREDPKFVTKVIATNLTGHTGSAMTPSWINTDNFLTAWEKIRSENTYVKHDWVVKLDPDAVFFPRRLKVHLARDAPGVGVSKYVMNCGLDMPPGFGMYGAIETVSTAAVTTFLDNVDGCKSDLPWKGDQWGEDLFLQRCLDHLGVGHVKDFDILKDGNCREAPAPCTAEGVAYHPYKVIGQHIACWQQGGGNSGPGGATSSPTPAPTTTEPPTTRAPSTTEKRTTSAPTTERTTTSPPSTATTTEPPSTTTAASSWWTPPTLPTWTPWKPPTQASADQTAAAPSPPPVEFDAGPPFMVAAGPPAATMPPWPTLPPPPTWAPLPTYTWAPMPTLAPWGAKESTPEATTTTQPAPPTTTQPAPPPPAPAAEGKAFNPKPGDMVQMTSDMKKVKAELSKYGYQWDDSMKSMLGQTYQVLAVPGPGLVALPVAGDDGSYQQWSFPLGTVQQAAR